MSCHDAYYFLVCRSTNEVLEYLYHEENYRGGLTFISSILFAVLFGVAIPYITNKISLDWMRIIPFFSLSVSGSIAVIGISHLINENRWFEYIGKNSLVFYMFNTLALNISVKMLVRLMNIGIPSVLVYLSILISTCLILVAINQLLNTKYLRFSLGKF